MTIRTRIKGYVQRLVVVTAAICGYGALAAPAHSASVGESVSGTTVSALSLAAGSGAAFSTNFAPGYTSTASGALTAVDTNGSWTLQVKDSATGHPGHMIAATGSTCTGSDAFLTNPLDVTVTSVLTGVVSAGQVAISAADQTVASASSQLLGASVLTTNYSQAIPSSEAMLTGCVYSITATYTLQ